MKSQTPKVLHRVCGTPMLARILNTVEQAGLNKTCLVLGDHLNLFDELLASRPNLATVIQQQRLGTGEAVAATACAFTETSMPAYAHGQLYRGTPLAAEAVLICAGDTPALEAEVLADFCRQCQEQKARLGVIGMRHPDPTGYGRLVLDEQDNLLRIVEDKDADAPIRKLNLCNSGVIYAERTFLFELLHELTADNQQGEYYLTDCFGLARSKGVSPFVYQTDAYEAFAGVNRRDQLAAIEAVIIRQKQARLMQEGVTFRLPQTTYLEDPVAIGRDTEIGAGCSLLGQTKIEDQCLIGPNCVLQNVVIERGSQLPAGTIRLNP
jgi:bifunctional UDP-N-acetylglucosamine pyrophosphorylase/glucosamine-1-phosphate N-acetyltransferase